MLLLHISARDADNHRRFKGSDDYLRIKVSEALHR